MRGLYVKPQTLERFCMLEVYLPNCLFSCTWFYGQLSLSYDASSQLVMSSGNKTQKSLLVEKALSP